MHSSKKINIAMIASNLELNGISAVIMNYVRYLDLNKFNITLIVGEKVDPNYQKICYSKNIKLIVLPKRKSNPVGFYLKLFKIFITNRFDIVHVHGSSSIIGMDLFLAKIAGVKIRIAHSHNTTTPNMKLHKLLKPLLAFSYTDGFSCSTEAGKWLFGTKHFTVIPNGIEVKKFKFNNKVRNEVRRELGLTDKYVIGHVGRFNYQKNHDFILQVFENVLKINQSGRLLLIGKGPDFEKIKSKISNNPKFNDKVILYGETKNPAPLYMAMDSFIFPSRFEGLPVTLIESQVSGLPCLASNVITKEVKLSNNLEYYSLNKSAAKWAEEILNQKHENRNTFFNNHIDEINKYCIKKDVKILEDKYINFINSKFQS